MYYILV